MDLSFKVVNEKLDSNKYTATCSGSRSDCCTRTCTRITENTSSIEAWEKYLEINAGVLQY
ncbi:MAG: hypothetical protein IBX55_20020 [Methyloprofundus sp.]|nr:hypothetical protein [Methyloprofundus sp.]